MQTVQEINDAFVRASQKGKTVTQVFCDISYLYTYKQGCGSGSTRMYLHEVPQWLAKENEAGVSVLINRIFIL